MTVSWSPVVASGGRFRPPLGVTLPCERCGRMARVLRVMIGEEPLTAREWERRVVYQVWCEACVEANRMEEAL